MLAPERLDRAKCDKSVRCARRAVVPSGRRLVNSSSEGGWRYNSVLSDGVRWAVSAAAKGVEKRYARDRGAVGAQTEDRRRREGGYGERCPRPIRLGGLGSIVSSISVVRGGASAEKRFLVHFEAVNATQMTILRRDPQFQVIVFAY